MRYILGIDQGGTKTAVLLVDDTGLICGHRTTDGAYFPETGIETAMSRIDILVQCVLEASSVSRDQIFHTVAGITGIDWPGDSQKVTAALQKTLKLGSVQAHNDCVIALFSGTQKPFGAVLCAGTGVNAAIFHPDGRQFVMSDYLGPELQGGSALSYRALRKVIDSELGLIPPTKLTNLFLNFTGAAAPYDMLKESVVNGNVFLKTIIPLVPRIIDIAETGDEVTVKLLDEFARELCDFFIAGLRKMDMLSIGFDIVLTGSVFKGARNRLVMNIVEHLSKAVPQAHILNAKYEPVIGACVMGLLQYGLLTQQVSDRLDASAHRFKLLRVVM